MKVIIAGCGRVGAQLADMLSFDGHEVTVLDNDPASFQRLSKFFSGSVIEGYAFDEEALERAGINEAQAYAAVTNFDNTNLMAAEVAEHVFHVPRVVARLYNPDKEETYQALGLDYVCGTKLMAQTLMEKILKPLIRIRSLCCNNSLSIVEFDCPSSWVGRKAAWVEEELGIRIAYVVRKGEALFPDEEFALQKRDEITTSVPAKKLQSLEKRIRSRGRR
jgi:trk system potassium uptake protein TrkA